MPSLRTRAPPTLRRERSRRSVERFPRASTNATCVLDSRDRFGGEGAAPLDSRLLSPQPKTAQPRIVVVEPRRFVELLVSRRNLVRLNDRSDHVHDRDTNETFVLDSKWIEWLARGA